MNIKCMKLVFDMDIREMKISDLEWKELNVIASIIWKIKFILRNWNSV